MTERRVAVTGIGVVAPCGTGADAFWSGLQVEPPAGERVVADWDPSPWQGPKEARRTDRFTQFAIATAALALEDAGTPDGSAADPDRSGVVVATGVGGIHTLVEQVLTFYNKGANRVSPFLVPMMMSNAAAAAISMRWGWRGPCETTVTACAAGTHAIGYALRLIRAGVCDVMIAGGTEAAINEVAIAGFANMTALSPTGTSRPFSAERNGFVMAEGAAVLVLEELEGARARGARIYAELAGTASTADAHHITAPEPSGAGAVRCMELAIADAGLSPGDIGHVNAHGTSTPLNDVAEAAAINKVFGAPGPPVTSTKGVTGHALGAAGALEAAATVLAINRGLIPPTIGTEAVDPEIDLDVVLGTARPWDPAPALSNSFGFGGHNGCLVFTPPPAG